MDEDLAVNVSENASSQDANCGFEVPQEHPWVEQATLLSGYLIYIISAIGLLGNCLTLKVLSRPRLKDCFHRLLLCLAIFDTIFLVFGSIKYIGALHKHDGVVSTILFPYLTHPFTEIGMSGTIFLTVAITVERYLGICHPMDFPAYRRKPLHYLIPVLSLAIGLNIPRFFETYLLVSDPKDNSTSNPYSVAINPLRFNEIFVTGYLTIARFVLLAFLPFLLLILLNFRIIADLKSANIQRFGSAQVYRKEKNLYLVLLSVVCTFILLHTPRLILDLQEVINYSQISNCGYAGFISPVWVDMLLSVSHLMVILNSSINFLLYCR